ncbi:MAG: glycosyltransferase family 4 protein [Armatimonadota bacterium]
MATLVVYSHKLCWRDPASPSGYSTDGAFPMQMRAISELFDSTVLVVPCETRASVAGLSPITGHRLSVVPLTRPAGAGLSRKLRIPAWLLGNLRPIARELRRADAVHAPIPGDIGTIGMLLAHGCRKRLFVRYCGNWLGPRTRAEHFWLWFMQRYAGGRNVMLATGGAVEPPSAENAEVRWIFSTSLTEAQLAACRVERRAPQDGRLRLIIAARQDPGKGTDLVIRALPEIARSFPKVTFDVVGDGSGLSDLGELAKQLGVAERVRFHGRLDQLSVLARLKEADLFCFPTRSEGFPKAVLEALACGLPVVTTPVSVLPLLIGTGCGKLVEPTPAGVAEGILGCASVPATYESLSAQAMRTAADYSLERWRDTIGALLQASWKCELRAVEPERGG